MMLTGVLEICGCGHMPDEHLRGGQCVHVNPVNAKRGWRSELCGCTRFRCDPRLVDGEDFAGKVLQKVVQRENIPLEPIEREEALQVLLMQLWRTSRKYDSRSHIRFRVYAYWELSNDAIDHFRSERGRHGQHRLLEHTAADVVDADVVDGDPRADRLGVVEQRDPRVDPDDWAADGGGLLTSGDRRPGRLDGGGRVSADQRDGVGDGRRGGAAPRRARAGTPRPGGVAAFVDCGSCGWRNYRQPPNGLPGWHQPDECQGCGATLGSGVTV